MTQEDEKLLKELEEAGKAGMQWAKDIREAFPAVSFAFFRLADACRKAADRLKPLEPELEGDRWCTWHVCAECHATLRDGQEKCRCGRWVKWR